MSTASADPDPGLASLQTDAVGFLRRFGLVSWAWTALLAATAPGVDRPAVLWAGVAIIGVWALASQWVRPPAVWFVFWLVAAIGAELLGPAAGTDGWSVVGGTSILVLAAAALSARVGLVVGIIIVLSATALARGLLSDVYSVGNSMGTLLIYGFVGLSFVWVTRVVVEGQRERDVLRRAIADAERDQAVANERTEAAARLHDSVLQHLTAIGKAADLGETQRLAVRASADLRQFIRVRDGGGAAASLCAVAEAAVAEAAQGSDMRFTSAGDVTVGEREALLVAAISEAVRNAVRHGGGAGTVFLEHRVGTTRAWVADRGPGFSLAAVPDDRLGVRESIVARLERAGGTAELRSTSNGTEWTLTLPAG